MTTKSILIIGDSIFNGGFVDGSLYTNNTLGYSLINGTRPASYLGHFYDDGDYVIPNATPPSAKYLIAPGHEYIMVSLFTNDFMQQGNYYNSNTVSCIASDAVKFCDYLHAAPYNYPYSKILFHFKYALSINDIGGIGFAMGPIYGAEVDVSGDSLSSSTLNRHFTIFHDLAKPLLQAKGVTVIDEWDFSVNGSAWKTQTWSAATNQTEYVVNFSTDGIHPGWASKTAGDINQWEQNLMGLIRHAIRNH